MGVTELFHFRRLLRRGRRVADGSRHFVIGLDKTSTDANSALSSTQSSSSPIGVLPKGSHFIVAYNRGVHLTEQEMDVCNNNNDDANNGEESAAPPRNYNGSRSNTGVVSIGTLYDGQETVVYSVMPGVSSNEENMHQRTDTMNYPAVAVIPTTELREATLFMSK